MAYPQHDDTARSVRLRVFMRVCVVYDCLFPYTVGGAERWYRTLAERLADEGHEVTYITLRQWERGVTPAIDPRVRVIAVGPRMALYTESGRRSVAPPLVFGLGVLWHLLRHGRRYDIVHSASFPYFSLLAAAVARIPHRFGLIVDWHEVWSADYWSEYLGPVAGRIGRWVQIACARVPQHAFCFSRLHAARLAQEGLRGEVTVLEGEYAGSLQPLEAVAAEPVVVFAGRMIPEKRAPLTVAAIALAARRLPGLQGVLYGDGPEHALVLAEIARLQAQDFIRAPGFVDGAEIDATLRTALCMLLASTREGYGMIVVEACAHATPSVLVAAADNAATELIEDGVNGVLARDDSAAALADAIVAVHEQGLALRERTSRWFGENARRLSLDSSLARVMDAYAGAAASAAR